MDQAIKKYAFGLSLQMSPLARLSLNCCAEPQLSPPIQVITLCNDLKKTISKPIRLQSASMTKIN
jgi:hypothetical protein